MRFPVSLRKSLTSSDIFESVYMAEIGAIVSQSGGNINSGGIIASVCNRMAVRSDNAPVEQPVQNR